MSSTLDIIAILTPNPGKIDRILDELEKITQYSKDNEPGTLKYEIAREFNKESGIEEIYMSEVYTDKAAYDIHMSSEPLQALIALNEKENLLAGPFQVKIVKVVGGFSKL